MKIISKKTGFTIIEIMLALVVLVFGIYGVLDLQATASKKDEISHFKTQLLSVGERKLVEVKAAGFDTLQNYIKSKSSSLTADVLYPDTLGSLPENKNIQWQSMLSLSKEDPNIVRIKVIISGNTPHNQEFFKTEFIDYITK